MMRHAQSRHAAIPDDDDNALTDDGTMCQYPGGGVPHNACRPPRSLWRGGYTSVGWICPEPTVDDDIQLAGPSTAGGSGGSSGSGGGGGDGVSTAVEPSLIRSDLEPQAQAQASPSNHSLSKSDETPRGQGCQTAPPPPPPPQTDGARVVPAVPGQSRPSTTAGVHQPPLVQQKSESSTGPSGLSGLSVGPGAPSTTRERRRSENALDALLDELQTFSPRSADSPSKRCLPVTEAIIGTGNSVGLSGDNRSKSTSALPLGASVATPAASSGNNSCTNSNSAAAVNGSSSASSKEVGAKKTPPPPPPRTTSKSPVQSPTGTGASSSTSVTNISVNSNNNSSSNNNNGNNENNNNNNSSSSSTSSSGNNNSNNSAQQQQQQQQQQQTARRCQSEPPSIRKISEQNSSGSSESVNSQEGTQNRQEMLEQRHQELLKKQKLLQEQYARLQLLQKLSPPKPDLKKTGSESNILHKASAHGASGICASHTSGSLTSLAASAGGPSNKITSSPSQPQLATSTSRNKIYETDIL